MTGETIPLSPADAMPAETRAEERESPVLTPPSVESPSRRSVILRLGLVVGMFVVVFGVIIPRYIDYEDVIDAIQALYPAQIAILAVLGACAWTIEGAAVAAPLPGLSIRRGTSVYLAAAGVKYTIPAPVDLPLRYAFFRGWGFTPAASTLAVAVNGTMDQVSRLILPLPAALLYSVEGTPEPLVILFAVVGTSIFAVLVGLYAWMIRSEPFTRRLGRLVDRAIATGFRVARRPAPAGVADRVVAFRDQTQELMRRRGALSLGVMVGAKLWWALLLTVSLRFAGVPAEVLPAPEVLAVFAGVFLILIIPIAPGGAAVPEVLFIAGLTALAGPGYEVQITAGVFIYRIFNWFLVIPIGWTVLWLLRRHAAGGLLGTHGQQDVPGPAGAGPEGGAP